MRPLRHLAIVILALIAGGLCIGPASASTTSGVTMGVFGTAATTGTKLGPVSLAANVYASGMVVSETKAKCSTAWSCTNTATITGNVAFGNDTRTLPFSMTYTDSSNWTLTITPSGSGSGSQVAGSPINLKNVSGTLGESGGVFTASLQVSGVTYRNVSMTGTVTIGSTGLTATTTLTGFTMPNGQQGGSLLITATASGGAVQTQLAFGTNGTPVNVQLTWTDANNWSATLTGGGGAVPIPAGSAVNVNNMTGTIAKRNGALSGSLVLSGSTVGDQTFDVSLSMTASGFQGSASASEVTLANGYRIDNPSITVSTATMSASISGQLETAGTTVGVNATYTDAADWSIQVQANSTGAGYRPSRGTPVNINNLSGTITDSGGNVSFQCTLSGVTVGDGTFSMTATITPSSVDASAVASNLVVGGFTFQDASISISTDSKYFAIQGGMTSDAGTFDVDVEATALEGGGYHMKMSADGADLAVGGPTFEMQSFGFKWESDVPASGCASFDVGVSGSLLMGNTTYTLNDAELAMSCQTVTKFVFSVTVSHTSTFDHLTKAVTLTIEWFGTYGNYTPTFGDKGQFAGPLVSYYSGFFGTVDLSRTRAFSRDGFSEDVTLGIGFSVEAYTQAVVKFPSTVGDPMTIKQGAPTLSVGAMGYFDANRVSGDIDCTFQAAPSTDFTCSGDMRVNPRDAGIWHESMNGM